MEKKDDRDLVLLLLAELLRQEEQMVVVHPDRVTVPGGDTERKRE